MNMLAHISAMPAILWLSVYCFDTLSNPALGTACLVIFMMFIPKTIFTAFNEYSDLRDRD